MRRRRIEPLDPNTIVLLKQIGFGVCIIALVGLLLTAVWYGTRLGAVTLTTVEVYGGETINHAQVEQLVLAQLEGEYLKFIPRTFAWTYPRSAMVEAVSGVERTHSIEVVRKNRSTIYVSFEEYLPNALWCKTLLALECVFIDETGYAYAQAPNLAGGSLLRFMHTSQPPEVGQSLTQAEDFQLLTQLTTLLADNNWFVSHVEVDKARDAFLHIVDGGEFKVTLAQSPEVTVNNLQVVLTSEEFTDVRPGAFQYIDLRFGNKVFINEEPPVIAVDEGADSENEKTATSSDDAAGE